MRRIRPDVLVLAELELWPNLIATAKRRGARVAVINGRLSEHSFHGYRRIRPLVIRLMRQIDLVAAQDETYAGRFRGLGTSAAAVHVTGSMKFDGAQTDRDNPHTQQLRQLAGFGEDDVVLLAGSTQEGEEVAVLDVFRQLSPAWPKLRLVLVPRHADRFDAVARLLDTSGLPWQRRSELPELSVATGGSPVPSQEHGQNARGTHCAEKRILLVDAIGELGAWWGTAGIAFVGGSLGNRGGQNMIEPAAYGAAVSFGPNTRNFRDIVDAMRRQRAAVVVDNAELLYRFVRRCLEEPDYAATLGDNARALVLAQLGATAETFRLLAALIENEHLGKPADRAA
jgi:3-deoxy-D-manno-octulosonic-acid transferase